MANSAHSSICGIGLGAENCYVAVARQGGIEILLNEYSQYSTPAYVGLGSNQRDLGTSAKQKQMTHLRTTFFAPSLLLGKKYSELDRSSIPFDVMEGPDDSISMCVEHAGVELKFTPTQLLAMVFTKLRQIGGNPVDCVINCPSFFNDIQRREMIDAARIAGLNPLKLINDTTSVALFHCFYRAPSEPKVICFFDVGQSSSQSSIFLFNPKDNCLTLLDTQYQADIGGRNFDELIANHFIESQKLELNARARCRLIAECEKLKKQMSANSNDLPIGIECLYNDRDFSARMDRTKFQELADPLFQQIQAMLQRNLEAATEIYNKDFAEQFGEFKVDSVEIFGGSSRVPSIKQMVKAVFGIEPSTTLNADEAVARGCALQCALLSPNFKIPKTITIEKDTEISEDAAEGLSRDDLSKHSDLEANLVLADKNWKEKTDAKNALEEFIYEWREKLSTLAEYIEPQEKDTFLMDLEATENWLYEQEDQDIMFSRSVYDERTNKMKTKYANKILGRKRDAEKAVKAAAAAEAAAVAAAVAAEKAAAAAEAAAAAAPPAETPENGESVPENGQAVPEKEPEVLKDATSVKKDGPTVVELDPSVSEAKVGDGSSVTDMDID